MGLQDLVKVSLPSMMVGTFDERLRRVCGDYRDVEGWDLEYGRSGSVHIRVNWYSREAAMSKQQSLEMEIQNRCLDSTISHGTLKHYVGNELMPAWTPTGSDGCVCGIFEIEPSCKVHGWKNTAAIGSEGKDMRGFQVRTIDDLIREQDAIRDYLGMQPGQDIVEAVKRSVGDLKAQVQRMEQYQQKSMMAADVAQRLTDEKRDLEIENSRLRRMIERGSFRR